jgi:hypothetical protein
MMLTYISGKGEKERFVPLLFASGRPRIPWSLAGGPERPFFPYQGVPSDAGCDLRQGLDRR